MAIFIGGVEQGSGGSATPEEIRDALLSIPEEERIFIVTEAAIGQRKVYGLRFNDDGNVEYIRESEPET